MFKTIRIIVLLFVLVAVAWGTWRTQVNSVKWKYTLPVNIYPINADGRPATQAYIQSLTVDDFKPLEAFMLSEAKRYGRESFASVEVRLGPTINSLPPLAPLRGGPLQVASWSLKMRWWAWRHGDTTGPGPQVKMYLLYFDPTQRQRLDHSTALQKGLIGLAQVFATPAMAGPNNIIIAHEFLHTLGATDKYDLSTNQPRFPDGFADPNKEPRFPQDFAEIMGGRTPLSPTQSEQPAHLRRVLIGEETAREINWLPPVP
jgi:hypothetical protein